MVTILAVQRLMCLDFKFCTLNRLVEHDETTFEDPSTDGGSNRLVSLGIQGLGLKENERASLRWTMDLFEETKETRNVGDFAST